MVLDKNCDTLYMDYGQYCDICKKVRFEITVIHSRSHDLLSVDSLLSVALRVGILGIEK